MVFMEQILYLIRHGHTSGTRSDLFYGATDLPITEDGYREVESFAADGVYPDPEGASVWTSGMLRTEQTLDAMYGDIEHSHEPLLKEINLGKYEMKTYSEIMEDDYGRAWLSGELETLSFEGGDSHESFNRRVTEGVWNILREAEKAGKDKVIAVLHGAVITYLMYNAFPEQYTDMWMWTPNPGTGYKVTVKDGRPVSWMTVGETGERVVPL